MLTYALIAACIVLCGLVLILLLVVREALNRAADHKARYDALFSQAYIRDAKGRIAKAVDVL